jgi:hypothetical protein
MAFELTSHFVLKLRTAKAKQSTVNRTLIPSGRGRFTRRNHPSIFA